MRILFIFHETGEHSGAWKSAHNLLSKLREYGVDLYILTPDKHEITNILKDEGFRVRSIKVVWYNRKADNSLVYRIKRIPFEIRRSILSTIWMYKAEKIVKSFSPNLIHSNSSVFYLGYDLAKKCGLPHVWHIREYGKEDFNLDTTPTKKRLEEHISYNVCISKCLQRSRNLIGDPLTTVIYNGIKNENETLLLFPKDNYILYVGSLNEGKGIKDILNAWHKYSKKNDSRKYKLLIAGGKPSQILKWKKYLVDQNLFYDNIEFLGKRDDISLLMSHSTALIVGSYSEAFGRVTAEAMFCGCLVIGRDSAGTKEQFDNGLALTYGEIGIRFNTIDELATLIQKSIEMSEEEYLSIVKRAQRTVTSLYSNEAHIKKMQNLYNKVLSK